MTILIVALCVQTSYADDKPKSNFVVRYVARVLINKIVDACGVNKGKEDTEKAMESSRENTKKTDEIAESECEEKVFSK